MTTALEATDKDFERMMQMLTGFWVTQMTGALATYSIADHLAKGRATAEQIANIEGIDSSATFRLLRACASLGLVTCDNQLKFSATPLLGTLQRNVPGSLHSLAILGRHLDSGYLGIFSEVVQTGKSQTIPALGAKLWDYYAQKPEEGAAFTQAMDGITSGIAEEVARVLDTSTTKLAIDVGGASGTLVHSLMMANPQLHGIILDLPDVVPSATAAASALGLCRAQQGVGRQLLRRCPRGGHLFAEIYSA